MLMRSNIGDHVWLMTSRQTVPDLEWVRNLCLNLRFVNVRVVNAVHKTNGRRFVGVLLRQDHSDFPDALHRKLAFKIPKKRQFEKLKSELWHSKFNFWWLSLIGWRVLTPSYGESFGPKNFTTNSEFEFSLLNYTSYSLTSSFMTSFSLRLLLDTICFRFCLM